MTFIIISIQVILAEETVAWRYGSQITCHCESSVKTVTFLLDRRRFLRSIFSDYSLTNKPEKMGKQISTKLKSFFQARNDILKLRWLLGAICFRKQWTNLVMEDKFKAKFQRKGIVTLKLLVVCWINHCSFPMFWFKEFQ